MTMLSECSILRHLEVCSKVRLVGAQSTRFQMKGKTVLEIALSEGSRIIAADTEAEADSWLVALNRVLEHQRTPVIPPSAEVVNLKRLQSQTQTQANQQQQQPSQPQATLAQLQSPTPNGGRHAHATRHALAPRTSLCSACLSLELREFRA